MSIEEEREARARDRARAAQRVINAYHVTFNSPDGKIVLDDLVAAFGINMPAFLPVGTRPGDGIKYSGTYGKIRDGQRSVYLHIKAKLDAPPIGDANITEGVEVLTGLSQ